MTEEQEEQVLDTLCRRVLQVAGFFAVVLTLMVIVDQLLIWWWKQ